MPGTHVTSVAEQPGRANLAPDRASVAIQRLRRSSEGASGRLAPRVEEPALGAPHVLVVTPPAAPDREARAADLVRRREGAWSPTASPPAAHRAEARPDVVHEAVVAGRRGRSPPLIGSTDRGLRAMARPPPERLATLALDRAAGPNSPGGAAAPPPRPDRRHTQEVPLRAITRFYVAEAPRDSCKRLFQAATVAECLIWVRPRSGPGMPRLAIWAAVAPPDDDPDVALCLPIDGLADATATAAEVADRWEASWLLIESAPRRHREEARAALVEMIATALTMAAARGFEDDADVGF